MADQTKIRFIFFWGGQPQKIVLFAEKEFADLQRGDGFIEMMDVHDFIDFCEADLSSERQFCIFPTEENCYIISAIDFYHDLREELDRIE